MDEAEDDWSFLSVAAQSPKQWSGKGQGRDDSAGARTRPSTRASPSPAVSHDSGRRRPARRSKTGDSGRRRRTDYVMQSTTESVDGSGSEGGGSEERYSTRGDGLTLAAIADGWRVGEEPKQESARPPHTRRRTDSTARRDSGGVLGASDGHGKRRGRTATLHESHGSHSTAATSRKRLDSSPQYVNALARSVWADHAFADALVGGGGGNGDSGSGSGSGSVGVREEEQWYDASNPDDFPALSPQHGMAGSLDGREEYNGYSASARRPVLQQTAAYAERLPEAQQWMTPPSAPGLAMAPPSYGVARSPATHQLQYAHVKQGAVHHGGVGQTVHTLSHSVARQSPAHRVHEAASVSHSGSPGRTQRGGETDIKQSGVMVRAEGVPRLSLQHSPAPAAVPRGYIDDAAHAAHASSSHSASAGSEAGFGVDGSFASEPQIRTNEQQHHDAAREHAAAALMHAAYEEWEATAAVEHKERGVRSMTARMARKRLHTSFDRWFDYYRQQKRRTRQVRHIVVAHTVRELASSFRHWRLVSEHQGIALQRRYARAFADWRVVTAQHALADIFKAQWRRQTVRVMVAQARSRMLLLEATSLQRWGEFVARRRSARRILRHLVRRSHDVYLQNGLNSLRNNARCTQAREVAVSRHCWRTVRRLQRRALALWGQFALRVAAHKELSRMKATYTSELHQTREAASAKETAMREASVAMESSLREENAATIASIAEANAVRIAAIEEAHAALLERRSSELKQEGIDHGRRVAALQHAWARVHASAEAQRHESIIAKVALMRRTVKSEHVILFRWHKLARSRKMARHLVQGYLARRDDQRTRASLRHWHAVALDEIAMAQREAYVERLATRARRQRRTRTLRNVLSVLKTVAGDRLRNRRLVLFAVQKIRHRTVAACFASWSQFLQHQREARMLLRGALGMAVHRALGRVWNTWRQAVLSFKQAELAAQVQSVAVATVARRWRNGTQLKAFNQWYQNVRERRTLKEKARKVVRRMRKLRRAAAFSAWRAHSTRRRRLRAFLRRTMVTWQQHGLAQGFRSLLANMLRRRRVELQATMAVRRLRSALASRAFAAWRNWNSLRARRCAVLGHLALRHRTSLQATGFRRWVLVHKTDKHAQGVVTRWIRHDRARNLRRAWQRLRLALGEGPVTKERVVSLTNAAIRSAKEVQAIQKHLDRVRRENNELHKTISRLQEAPSKSTDQSGAEQQMRARTEKLEELVHNQAQELLRLRSDAAHRKPSRAEGGVAANGTTLAAPLETPRVGMSSHSSVPATPEARPMVETAANSDDIEELKRQVQLLSARAEQPTPQSVSADDERFARLEQQLAAERQAREAREAEMLNKMTQSGQISPLDRQLLIIGTSGTAAAAAKDANLHARELAGMRAAQDRIASADRAIAQAKLRAANDRPSLRGTSDGRVALMTAHSLRASAGNRDSVVSSVGSIDDLDVESIVSLSTGASAGAMSPTKATRRSPSRGASYTARTPQKSTPERKTQSHAPTTPQRGSSASKRSAKSGGLLSKLSNKRSPSPGRSARRSPSGEPSKVLLPRRRTASSPATR